MFIDKKKTIVLVCLTTVFIVLFEILVLFSVRYYDNKAETELYRKAYAVESEIEKVLLNIYTISDAYSSYISTNPDVTREETEVFLNHLFTHEENYLRNIAYVENSTIKYNFPHEENSNSIGIDLSLVDTQKDALILVESTRSEVFIGPVELVQGGEAYILLTPVVVGNTYYGHISSVIDADNLNSLLDVNAEKYDLSLTMSLENEMFDLTSGDTFSHQFVSVDIEQDYATWELTVYANTPVYSKVIVASLIRVFYALVIIGVCYYVYRNTKSINEMKYKATHDSLTSNYNREKFIRDYKKGVFYGDLIAYMDMNKFKLLNDTLGHQIGDWVLIELTKKFKESNQFYTYRNSGDEFFLVSIEPMKEHDFITLLENFNYQFYNENLNQTIDVSLSVGVIEVLRETLPLETVLIYLDYAMYDAKRKGITYTLVDDKLMKKYNEQKEIEYLLINDIRNNKLLTYYQPIIDVNKKTIFSVEVLTRWKYKGEIITAGRFIDVAKKIKYIENIDHNLFDNLQKEYVEFKKRCKGIENLTFSINLSAELLKTFETDYSKFDKYISSNIIPKENIIFEISEDINLGIISSKTIDYIKSKGFKLVIDDFGSGVSKLSDVLSGELFAIKTDKAMLPKSMKETKRLKGFNTIVKAVNSTGSKVCVEGVETFEQLEIAQNAGCELLQGYLFNKGEALDKTIDFINHFDEFKWEK